MALWFGFILCFVFCDLKFGVYQTPCPAPTNAAPTSSVK